MKQKAKDKVRTEKERMLAERDAKLEAERAVLEETRRALLEKEEEVKYASPQYMLLILLQCAENAMCTLRRKQKLEKIEKRRQEEEEQMEARRRELLSEEDGYWRRRMAQEAQTQALQEESIVKANPQVCHTPPWWQMSCVLIGYTGSPSPSWRPTCISPMHTRYGPLVPPH